MKVERLLGAHGIARDTPAGRREFELRMEARRAESDSAEWKKVRRGWMLGSEEFRQELLGRMEEQVGLSHYGAELRESEEKRARRIIAEEMQKRKFPVLDFGRLSKSASSKVRIARRIRAETAMPLRWIVQELQMGSIGYAARILRERSKVRD